MNQRQNQKYKALANCAATASQNAPAWAGYAPFSEPWTAVLAKKVILDGLIAEQTNPFTAAGQKAIYRIDLKSQLAKAITALDWLAGTTHDKPLYKLEHLNIDEIDRAKEAELVGLATKRHELVVAHATALLPVNYTSTDAGLLLTSNGKYSGAIGTPGAEHDTHEQVTDQIEVVLNDIYTILSSQCDPAVAALADAQPAFAAQWELSREIGNSTAHRTRALEVHIEDSLSHEPIAEAVANFSPADHAPTKHSAAGGSFYIQNMPPGDYTMQVARPGYTTREVPVVIVDGQKAVVSVLLVKS